MFVICITATVLFLQLTTVLACTCATLTLKQAYHSSSTVHSVKAKPVHSMVIGEKRFYTLQVEEVFKGCSPGDFIGVQTALSSAACGVTLSNEASYVFNLPSGENPNLDACQVSCIPTFFKCFLQYNLQYWQETYMYCNVILQTTMQFFKKYADLTTEELNFLDTREVCCGQTCECRSTSPPVNCFVEPCAVAEPPCEEAEECKNNFCGGCVAEWFTSSGMPAC